MQLDITINLDGAALADSLAVNDGTELADVLGQVTDQIEGGRATGTLRDSYGNTVGSYSVTGD